MDDLERNPGFADPAGAGDRHEAGLLEDRLDHRQIGRAAEQPVERPRQSGGGRVAVHRPHDGHGPTNR